MSSQEQPIISSSITANKQTKQTKQIKQSNQKGPDQKTLDRIARMYNTVEVPSKKVIAQSDKEEKVITVETLPIARKSIICIRGHVDSGKTSFISSLASYNTEERKTSLNDQEAGGITQQVGTTTFNRETLLKFIPEKLHNKFNMDFVTVDTPGHASFENIRRIGSSISHITLVFTDITKEMSPESLEFLQSTLLTKEDYDRTFIVLNKIDRIYDYKKVGYGTLKDVLEIQSDFVKEQIESYYTRLVIQLSKYQLWGQPYYKKKDRECITMLPISAVTGDGIPDLLLYMSNVRMTLDKPTESIGYIIDKRNDQRLGKILVGIMKYGSINKSNAIQIKDSIFPIKNLHKISGQHDSREHQFDITNSVDEAISFIMTVDTLTYDVIDLGSQFTPTDKKGINVATIDDAVYDTYIAKKTKLLSDSGIFVVIPSESMIDGIHDLFSSKEIPINGYSVGSISKQELMKFINRNNDQYKYGNRYKCILICMPTDSNTDDKESKVLMKQYFDEEKLVMIKNAKLNVIFSGTIYKLAEKYNKYLETCKQEFVNSYAKYSTFQATSLPKCIFKTKNPVLCGITITDGIIGLNTIVKDSNGKEYGIVQSIQHNDKDVKFATTGMEVCIKIIGGSESLDKKLEYTFSNVVHDTSNMVGADIKSL